jgi:hypothetical protein
MTRLTFYKQRRRDGGVRSGIELDDETTLLWNFRDPEPGTEDDPLGSALDWYIDLRCQGESLPLHPEAARAWFLENAPAFREAALALAQEMSAGWNDFYPVRWGRFSRLPEGVTAELVCSAVRRVAERGLGRVIEEYAESLEQELRSLQAREFEPIGGPMG